MGNQNNDSVGNLNQEPFTERFTRCTITQPYLKKCRIMHQAEGKRVILRKICRRDQQISFWSLQFCHGKCILSSKGVQRLELFGLYEKKEREFTDCNFRGKNIVKQFEIVILAQPAPVFSRIET